MNFGDALAAIKRGEPVTRRGWNGKNMFLYLADPGAYAPLAEVEQEFWRDLLVPHRPYIAIKAKDGLVSPWLASQTDLLADDWQVLDMALLREMTDD